jgi:uncharacterized Zn finger protein
VNYQLLANSSSGDGSYDVTVSDQNGNLEIECTCTAGEMSTMCKHRIAVITGKYADIIDIDDPENADASWQLNSLLNMVLQSNTLRWPKNSKT